MKPYIFLDRDGTINKEKGYLHTIDDFEFEDGAVEGLKVLSNIGFGFVVITNQSGIARGYYSMNDVERVHEYMCNELDKEGVKIAKIYICPHGPEDNCRCRKPRPGLFEDAIKDLNVDVVKSYAVGDRIRDIEPAKRIGLRYAMLLTGHGKEEGTKDIRTDQVFNNLLEFARYITSK